jgi:LacI family transcriptional regulator
MPGITSPDVTIADIAEAAGVSTATVSRVLNDHPYVAEETRLRVQRLIEQTGYQNKLAQKHRAETLTNAITVIASLADNEYINAILWGIQDQLDLDDYHVMLRLWGADPASEFQCVRLAQHNGSKGLIVVTSRLRGSDLSDLMRDDIPYVFIDYYADSPEVPYVRSTNWQGARDLTRYLVSLGHRRIGFVAGIRGLNITEAREHGYRSALVEAGIPFDSELVVEGDFGQESGYRAGRRLLALDEPPTAVFACTDLSARGVIDAARTAGLRVPHDLSVAGFDDIPSSATRQPPLTTVRQPLHEMGRMAAQMAVALADGRELLSRQIELPTQLIVRESCRAPGSPV